jgi:hypothetical protein
MQAKVSIQLPSSPEALHRLLCQNESDIRSDSSAENTILAIRKLALTIEAGALDSYPSLLVDAMAEFHQFSIASGSRYPIFSNAIDSILNDYRSAWDIVQATPQSGSRMFGGGFGLGGFLIGAAVSAGVNAILDASDKTKMDKHMEEACQLWHRALLYLTAVERIFSEESFYEVNQRKTSESAPNLDDIKFTCPKCDQHLRATLDMQGLLVQCSSCKTAITVPQSEYTKCPFCSGIIRTGAVKCQNCNKVLINPARQSVPLSYAQDEKKTPISSQRSPARVSDHHSFPKHRRWIALVVFAALVVTPFAPNIPFALGCICLVLCVGTFSRSLADLAGYSGSTSTANSIGQSKVWREINPDRMQSISRRLLRYTDTRPSRNWLRLLSYSMIGSVLMFAGVLSRNYKADQAHVARQRSAANAKVRLLVDEAINSANIGDISSAANMINEALALPNAVDLEDARKLERVLENATDPVFVRNTLLSIPDYEFTQLMRYGTMPRELVTGYAGLDRRTAERTKADVDSVAQFREERRVAQIEAQQRSQAIAHQKAEAERQQQAFKDAEKQRKADAQMEAQQRSQAIARQKAEVERQQQAFKDAEKQRKAEEEYDADGLILLRKSITARRGQFDGVISGAVINRRTRKLNYAQITFILYDKSGAQVGTAFANITDLEPRATWKFSATTFGTDFSSYKFSELDGY